MEIGDLLPYLTTGHTTTTGMLSVLADATVTGADVATVLSGLTETGRHLDGTVWYGTVLMLTGELVMSDSAIVSRRDGLQKVFLAAASEVEWVGWETRLI
jgi:hypothetical protein